ncbi:MAG: molecular chaperone DnaK, partial [Gammaproteobacteria bacterium]|nr:molecular chaperone DnaK [Gammaproteobacteria bacterium]
MKEYGEQLSADEKAAIESAVKDAEAVVKSDDKEAIEAKAEALATAAQKLGEKMYAAEQAKAQAAQGGAAPGNEAKADEGDVVDAEFTEVKDKK